MAAFDFDGLPAELKLMVFEYVKDRKTLYRMMRVKKDWNTYASDQLWAKPPCRALATVTAVSSGSRCQYYASKILSLSLHRPEPMSRPLRFDSLRSLSFGQGAGSETINHDSFIQSSLRELSFSGEGTFAAESLTLVRQRCPDLRSLRVFHPFSFDPGLFIGLLQNCQHLTSLYLGYNFDSSVIEDFLTYLAGSLSTRLEELTISSSLEHIDTSRISNFLGTAIALRKLILGNLAQEMNTVLSTIHGLDTLRELEIRHRLTFEQVSLLLQEHLHLQLFQRVHKLSLHGDARALSTLLSSRSITTLELDVQYPNESFFSAIGSMTQLMSLDLTFHPAEHLSEECLKRLQPLLNLRRLRMSKVETWDDSDDLLQLPWITDDLFEQFLVSFPLLEQLYLDWDLADQVTEISIAALARSCPALRRTMLMWTHDLKGWHNLKKPSFTNLEFLGLGGIHEFAGRR